MAHLFRTLAQTSSSTNGVLSHGDQLDTQMQTLQPSKPSRSTESLKQASTSWNEESAILAADGRLSEILICQAANSVPEKERVQPDLVQNEYAGKLIGLLRPFSVFEDLIHCHCKATQVFTITSSLVLEALPHVNSFIEQDNVGDSTLSQKITENTLRPLIVPASISASKFHTLFTGQNLRWEFVGFLFACAGRSALTKPCRDGNFLNSNLEIVDRATFLHQLMMASRTCIALW